MSEGWTHSVCDRCWELVRGARDTPHKIVEEYREVEGCCACGMFHRSGIYVRANPELCYSKVAPE